MPNKKVGYAITGRQAYQYYVAIKAHFNSEDFNFTKYGHNLVKIKESYESRNDRELFRQLSTKYVKSNIVDFLVSNFIKHPNIHISELLNMDAHDTYLNFVKRKTSMHITYRQEIIDIVGFAEKNNLKIRELFEVKGDKLPIIFRMYIQNLLSIETFVILDNSTHILTLYDKLLKDDYTYNIYRLVLHKYKLILKYNREDYHEITKTLLAH